ncbi:MAG: hypothetical protein HYT07_03680 [Candidatus Levybacteria bacterium]|nr:hypothetical protein [Candidatus Levybacteria bacterium]
MDFNSLDFANFFQPVLFVKIVTLIIIGFYLIFSVVIFTQVRAMSQILNLPHAEVLFETLAIINIIAAASLFLGAFVIL